MKLDIDFITACLVMTLSNRPDDRAVDVSAFRRERRDWGQLENSCHRLAADTTLHCGFLRKSRFANSSHLNGSKN